MEYTNTPVALPLPDGMTRCLAHGDSPHDWCERRGECAAHETIKHDGAGSQLVVYRKCQTDSYVGFVPMGGFSDPGGAVESH